MNITFYKYRITDKHTKECKLCFKYEEVKKYTGIPRSTLYRVLNGENKNKYVNNFIFEKIRIPREDVKTLILLNA
jgi:predicted transcriptional regulator